MMHSQPNSNLNGRKLLRVMPQQITSVLQANVLWSLGITGMLHSFIVYKRKIDLFLSEVAKQGRQCFKIY